jgi:RNA polymerase sigma factor (sigma-70 family)
MINGDRDDVDDSDAGALWRACFPMLKRLAFMVVGDDAAAEDAVTVAFTRSLPHLDSAADPVAYLRTAVINACRDHIRGSVRRRVREVAAAPSVEVWMDVGHIEVRDALLALPLRQRTAVVLRHVVDLDDAAIAASMGCRPSSVRSLVRHGLARLRKELSQ